MKSKLTLKKIVTLSAAIILATPIFSNNLTKTVSAETESQNKQLKQDNNQVNKESETQKSQEDQKTDKETDKTETNVPDAATQNKKPANITAKKVKTFKVAIVKKNYGIYLDNFTKKKAAKNYFHQTFNVNKKFTHNGKTYYWLNKKGKKSIGYINKKAVATPNQAKTIEKTPYVSQYVPVKTPWGCAGASMAMLLGSQGQKITTSLLTKIQNNLPMQPVKGGQKGNVYTGVGFGYVISPGALAKYARTFKKGKKIINISSKKLTVDDLKMYIQAGKPVLYYGFSSYQKAGDYKRNHCKVITGYKKGKFLVYDPLYYSKFDKAGTGGKNMNYDHGAIAWVPESAIQAEFCHKALSFK